MLEGCRGAASHSLSVWDALIWATAMLNQVPYVLTEDMQHGLFLEGVRPDRWPSGRPLGARPGRFQSPFAPQFDPTLLEPGG